LLPHLRSIGPATATLLRLVKADPDAAVYADDPDLWAGYRETVEAAYADAADHDRSYPALEPLGLGRPYKPPPPWAEWDIRCSPADLEWTATLFDRMAVGEPCAPDTAPVALSIVCARHAARLRRFLPAMHRRAAFLADRFARLRRPPENADRLPPGWLDRAKLVPLPDVLLALGVETARGRWRGCPACKADVDGTRRGIVAAVGNRGDGWICNNCRVSGDGLTWVAYTLTSERTITADVGRWYAARWNLS